MTIIYLGLDISKDKIDAITNSTPHITISNDEVGYKQLLDYLSMHQLDLTNIHACCESTNIYYLGISEFLYQRNIKISVINPTAIKAYAKMQLRRVKTDKQDAKLIADYCRKEQPDLWQPESSSKRQLKNLHRRIEQINEIYIQEQNRLQVADECVKPFIEKLITALQVQIEDCRRTMQLIIDKSADLKRKQQNLETIPGIGKTTAQILLSVLIDLDKFQTAKHLISYLGLSPIIRDSGKYKGFQRVSKMGNRSVRKSLYMPARAACTRSKLWRAWFDYQVGRGKHPKQVYVMMMCKILRYAYVCLKAHKPFDASLHQKLNS